MTSTEAPTRSGGPLILGLVVHDAWKTSPMMDPDQPPEGGAPCVLLGADRRPYRSSRPGRCGGHRRNRIYGRLDRRTALNAISDGRYVANRVFFADEPTAVAAGYRPCAMCMPRCPPHLEGPQMTPTTWTPPERLR